MARLILDPEHPVRRGERGFTMESWMELSPFEQLLGMRIVEASEGEALLEMPFTLKLSQGLGLLHGGALTSLADTAVALAIKSLLPEGTRFATIELNTSFLAPVFEGIVTARARTSKEPGRRFRGRVELRLADGSLVAQFESLFKVAAKQGFDW